MSILTISKNGTGYTYTAERSFDAWGNMRLGAQSGDPKGRFCKSLGHKQCDEFRLTYMRSRYYETLTGKFIDEDPGRSGRNWFAYCRNDPTDLTDSDGRSYTGYTQLAGGLLSVLIGEFMSKIGAILALNDMKFIMIWELGEHVPDPDHRKMNNWDAAISVTFSGVVAAVADACMKPADLSPATKVISLKLEHLGSIQAFIGPTDR